MAFTDEQIKAWFETGDKPTEVQFANFIESKRSRNEEISMAEVTSLLTVLAQKAQTVHTHTAVQITDLTVAINDVLNNAAGVSIAPIVAGLIPVEFVPGAFKEVLSFDTAADFPGVGEADKIYVDKSDGFKQYQWDGAEYIPTSEGNNKYVNENVLPKTIGGFKVGSPATDAVGLSTKEMFDKLLFPPVEPTGELFTDVATLPFNEVNATVSLTWNYNILSSGANMANLKIEVSRDGGLNWIELLNTNADPGNYDHTPINSTGVNNAALLYRLTITDSVGASASFTKQVTFLAYATPSIVLTLSRTGNREKGDVQTTLSGSIAANSQNINILSYQLQYNVNNAGWNDLGAIVDGINDTDCIVADYDHNDATLINSNSIAYRIKVIDEQQTTYSVVQTISFYFRSYFGYTTEPGTLNSGQIIAVGNSAINTTKARSFSNVTAAIDQYTGYFYAKSLGALTTIIMNGALPVLGAFTVSEVNFTNAFGVTALFYHVKSNSTKAFNGDSLNFQ